MGKDKENESKQMIEVDQVRHLFRSSNNFGEFIKKFEEEVNK